MTNINITSPAQDIKARYDEYADLLVRRDRLFARAESYRISYTAEFGEQLAANFEIKIECIKMKKTISYCQRRINRDLPIDITKMHAEIEKEMLLYNVQLREMIDDAAEAKNAKSASHIEAELSKKIYRRLAKKLHPDVNRATEENEELRDLWERIAEAYRAYNSDELEALEVLATKALEKLGDAAYTPDYENLEEKIERTEKQINDIISTAPYSYGEILASKEKRETLKNQLEEEHKGFEHYLETLKEALDDLLNLSRRAIPSALAEGSSVTIIF